MKIQLVPIYILFVFLSCSREVDIPARHVGVVVEDGIVKPTPLPAGRYVVRDGTNIVLFQTGSERMVSGFDFLFLDSVEGSLEFSVEFAPIPGGMAEFLKLYQTNDLKRVFKLQSRRALRDFMMRHQSQDFQTENINTTVLQALRTDRGISRYFSMKSLTVRRFQVRNEPVILR